MSLVRNSSEEIQEVVSYLISDFRNISAYNDTLLVCNDGSIFINGILLSLVFSDFQPLLSSSRELMSPNVVILPDISSRDVLKDVKMFWTKKERPSAVASHQENEIEADALVPEIKAEIDQLIEVKNEKASGIIDEIKAVGFEDKNGQDFKEIGKSNHDNENNTDDRFTDINTDSVKVYNVCQFCPKTFLSKEEKFEHEKKHVDGESKTYICIEESCKEFFSHARNLKEHINVKHESKNVGIISCIVCGNGFENEEQLETHSKRYIGGSSEYRCPREDCDETSYKTKRGIIVHYRNHKDIYKMFCLDCNTTLENEMEIQLHKKANHKGIKNMCKVCDKLFPDKARYWKHVAMAHANQETKERYRCDQCGKGFILMQKLTDHILAHENIRNHKCNNCGKKFIHVGDLRKHERRHADVKPYQCSYCDKGFIASDKVKRHELIHNGMKDYECSKCGKAFNQRGNKRTHEIKCKMPDPPCVSEVK